jgi:hypothetical protein
MPQPTLECAIYEMMAICPTNGQSSTGVTLQRTIGHEAWPPL